MRFINYLNEQSENLSKSLGMIEDKCKPFLNDLKRIGKPDSLLFSGRPSNNLYISKPVRKNREPTHTPTEVHHWLDNGFYRKFSIYARSNTLFTTPRLEDAESFNTAYIIFPEGNYEIIGNPKIEDLYLFRDLRRVFDLDTPLISIEPDNKEQSEILQKLNEYQTGNLEEALKYSSEIMLHCKYYSGLNTRMLSKASNLDDFLSGLQDNGIYIRPYDLEL